MMHREGSECCGAHAPAGHYLHRAVCVGPSCCSLDSGPLGLHVSVPALSGVRGYDAEGVLREWRRPTKDEREGGQT